MTDAAEDVFGDQYRDKRTRLFASGKRIPAFQSIEEAANRRLLILLKAKSLGGLRAMGSNRLEALGGDRLGQFSIRINHQWRICFEWDENQERPYNIEIVDYH